MQIIAADHVIPISEPPIRDGAVAFDADVITAVGRRDDIARQFPSAEIEDFGEAAILPGFINCHSHLEITSMRGALDEVEHDFKAWLLRLTALREAMSDGDIEASALAGAIEGVRAGVTCFGDIGRMGRAGLNALKRAGLRGIVYQETEFSPDNATAADDLANLIAKYEALAVDATDLVTVGLSPHSPYTVGSALFEMIAQFSIIERVPLSIHVAESAHEDELLRKGTGFFAGVYEKFGLEWQSPLCSPVEYLERLGVLAAKPLLVHCVYASGPDIERIAANRARIAHCPRSNAKFGHGWAPFEAFLDAGIAVGIGSDSVASNNVCDILGESRFAALAARNRPGSARMISAREALEAATLGGARALDLDAKIGTLEPGKQADFAVVSLEHSAQRPVNDIHAALVFSSNARDVIRTVVAGRSVDPDSLSVTLQQSEAH